VVNSSRRNEHAGRIHPSSFSIQAAPKHAMGGQVRLRTVEIDGKQDGPVRTLASTASRAVSRRSWVRSEASGRCQRRQDRQFG